MDRITADEFAIWQRRAIADVVSVTAIGPDRFRNIVAQRNSRGQLFGGQIVGLALQAASETVVDRPVHAMNGYFLRLGTVQEPVELAVERVFDGGSFSNRRVSASQSGKLLFQLQASFQAEENGVEHALRAGSVPDPESLPRIQDLVEEWGGRVPQGAGNRLRLATAIDLRPVDPLAYFVGDPDVRQRSAWIRTSSAAGLPDSMHRSILAYMADYWLAETASMPHERVGPQRLFLASLNQSTWFYRRFRMDDWLLVEAESETAQGGRGIGRSRVFDREGLLIAAAEQEVLIRSAKNA